MITLRIDVPLIGVQVYIPIQCDNPPHWCTLGVPNLNTVKPLLLQLPNSLADSIRKHLRLFKKDVVEDWLPRLPSVGPLRHVKWGRATDVPPIKHVATGVKSEVTELEDVNFKLAKYDPPIYDAQAASDVANDPPLWAEDLINTH